MTPIESNRMIADSLFASDNTKINIEYYIDSGNDKGLKEFYENLQYHSDWDMIMPVVEKIRNATERMVLVQNTNSTILRANAGKGKDFDCHIHQVGVQAVYTAVLQFINWYNTQQTTP